MDKKEESPKQIKGSKFPPNRNIISSLKPKYRDKKSIVKHRKIEEVPPSYNLPMKNRSHSHYLPTSEITHYDLDVKNHLKDI